MKTNLKHLGLLLVVWIMAIPINNAFAGTVTFQAGTDITGSTNLDADKSSFNIHIGSGSMRDYEDYRCYANQTIKVTAPTGFKMTKVVFYANGDYHTSTHRDDWTTSNVSVKSGSSGTYSYNSSAKTGTWTYATGTNTFTLSNTKQLRFVKVEITYTAPTCNYMIYNGSTYTVWKTLSQDVGCPVGPEIAGYYPMIQGSENFVWCEIPITESMNVTCKFINNSTGTLANKYHFSVDSPSKPENYPNGATTLYGVYVKEGDCKQVTTAKYVDDPITIIFNKNGGSGTMANQTVTKNATATLNANTYTRTNYQFKGWDTNSAGTTVVYADRGTVKFSANTTLYAVWKQLITITFYPNGATGSSYTQQMPIDETGYLIANKFTREGYSFVGWNLSSSATTAQKTDKASITPHGNIDFNAIWSIKQFTVDTEVAPSTAKAAGCTATIDNETNIEANYNTSHAIKATAASGWYFIEWTRLPTVGSFTNANLESTTYTIGNDDVTLTANFGKYLHVTYNANGGSGAPSDAKNYKSGENVSISSTAPTRSGYVFLGWSKSNTATSATYTKGQSSAFSITADETLYAVWCKDVSGATLTFSASTPTYNYSTGKGETTLSWVRNVDGATSYEIQIKHGSTTDLTYTTVSGTERAFNTMVPGTTYEVTLRAKDNCTEVTKTINVSVACPAMSGTMTITAPDVTVTKTSAVVNFSLTNASEFEVWLTLNTAAGTEVAGSRSTITATAGAASKTFSGLTNDTKYYVHAIAKNNCGNVSAEKKDVTFTTKHEEVYHDFIFECVTISATGSTNLTTAKSQLVIAPDPIAVAVAGGREGAVVQFTSADAALKFFTKDGDGFKEINNTTNKQTLGADGSYAADVYLGYQPSAEGDGSIVTPAFSIKCDAEKEDLNGSGEMFKARIMPDKFVIAARTGNVWLAVPANITGMATQDGIAIKVDDINNPTVAQVTVNTSTYGLQQLNTPTRRQKNGTANYFVSAVNSKCLNQSTSTSTSTQINTGATPTNAGTSPDALFYEWQLTSTDLVEYTITNSNTTQTNKKLTYSENNGKWGVYASGIQTTLRLLPIEIELTDLGAEVMEWGDASLALRLPDGIGNEINITYGDIVKNNLQLKPIGSGSDLFRVDGLNISAKPCDVMSITTTDGLKGTLLRTPILISATKNSADIKTAVGEDICPSCDAVVLNGGKLVASEAKSSYKTKFFNLYIYPGGILNINDKGLGLNGQFYLRGGFSWLGGNGEADFKVPEVYVSGGTFTGSGNALFDYYIDNRQFYGLSVPYTIPFSKITDETSAYSDFPAWIQVYDGARRASGAQVSGWVDYYGPDFKAGVGYTVAAKPRQDDARKKNRPFAIVRLPLGNSVLTGGEAQKDAVPVTAHGIEDYSEDRQTANNVGWNFMGNPYLASFSGTSDDDAGGLSAGAGNMTVGHLVETYTEQGNWDGSYHWEERNMRYVTVPGFSGTTYSQVRAKDFSIEPYHTFFIQVEEDGEFTMTVGKRVQKMPTYKAPQQTLKDIEAEILLFNEQSQDNMGIIINDDYSSSYEFGDDLVKEIGAGDKIKVYTLANDIRLAYNALNENAALSIPVGYRVLSGGEYTFGLSLTDALPDVESIILIDHENGNQTNLLYSDYSFESAAEQNDVRFSLTIKLPKNRVWTSIDSTDSGTLEGVRVASDNGMINIIGLPDDAQIYVYDMAGKLVSRQHNKQNRLQIAVPQGAYSIRIISNEGNRTLKAIVK